MQEITKDNLYEGFLGYGLFAEKLPPFLSSESFLTFSKSAKSNIFDKNDKGYIQYENIRNINIPRLLAIPEPIAYRNLCMCLSENWDKLIEHFKNHTEAHEYKISRIHIRKIKDTKVIFEMGDYGELYETKVLEEKKHLFEMSHKNFYEDDYPEPHLLIGNSYQVKADISNFFPSIYTHSIPWALVGKKLSKVKKVESELWFNELDFYTRNLKSQETHGILIGPHVSNLLSEIILVVIDNELYQKGYRFVRNIDDYTCFVESNEKAELFLIDISNALKSFNLSLNHKKTEITKLPLASSKNWTVKLNSDPTINDNSSKKLSHIRNYLDTALDLMVENNHDSAILNYAIKVISSKKLFPNALDYYLSYIHHLTLIYPYLTLLLDEYVFIPLSVPKDKIEEISTDLFKMGKDKNIYEAISYSLYFSIRYDFSLGEKIFDEVKASKDCILLLLAYLHDKKYLRKSYLKPYKDLAEQLKTNDFDEFWLFIYEVSLTTKLNKYWKKMKEKKISFIKVDFGS